MKTPEHEERYLLREVPRPNPVGGRDPVYFCHQIRDRVLPFLRTFPSPRLWYCGCSSPQELFGLAVLLKEEGLERARIYATDFNPKRLGQVSQGIVAGEALEQWNSILCGHDYGDLLHKYYSRVSGGLKVTDSIRQRLILFQHNVATDASFNEFHFILFRDKRTSRFRGSAGEKIHSVIHSSLASFGYLTATGRFVEEALDFQSRYLEVDPRLPLYKRVR